MSESVIKVHLHDAKTHLSRWLKRVEAGEVLQICRHNVPIAELRPIASVVEPKKRPPPGLFRGRIEISDSFFDPLPDEELDSWEGKGP